MQVALFLDIDDTLTRAPIQSFFARHLGVYEQYRELEANFQSQQVSSAEFGQRLVALFAEQKFNRDKAAQIYPEVELQPWSERLLSLQRNGVDIYFISSGPSYYIEELARRHDVPAGRVLCSKYSFDSPGAVISSCNAVSGPGKAQFVKDLVSKYPISIGIGDHVAHDGPFIVHCTLGFLTVHNDQFPYIPSFEHIINLVSRLTAIESGRHGDAQNIDLRKLSVPQLLHRFTFGSWLTLAGVLSAAFALGAFVTKFWGAAPKG
jgi:HAD superfamily phosphoserine phosphatase-like hydrolase